MSGVHYVENYVIQKKFSEKDACSVGDLISLRNIEVYVLARVVISRVNLHTSITSFATGNFAGCQQHAVFTVQPLIGRDYVGLSSV